MKNKMDAKGAIQAVAQREGISEAELRKQIEIAIEEALQSEDPVIQSRWKRVRKKGEKPTVEEVLAHLIKMGAAIGL